jgi:hypothetical protein
MWIIIIIVIVFIVGKFLLNTNEQNKAVAKQGGMDFKYRDLIAILMAGDERSKIYQLTASSVTLGVSSIGGMTVFTLTQTFGKVTIQWKMESPIFGKHKMEWTFNEYMEQTKMAEIIMNELGKYQENVLGAQGLEDL